MSSSEVASNHDVANDSSSNTPARIVTAPSRGGALLSLQVKALAQPLGSENAWSELGDGRVEYDGYRIRVADFFQHVQEARPISKQQPVSTPDGDESPGRMQRQDETVIADDSTDQPKAPASPTILLEDTITDDTPFVGENSCIVWNSIDQELSLCMMFSSDVDFQAAWSALAALQHKPYPPFGVDLLERCRRSGSTEQDRNEILDDVPYSQVLHDKYDVPLGVIEKHALALSLIENEHLGNPNLYEEPAVCALLLRMAHPDLIENLVAPAIYPLLLRGLDASGAIATPAPKIWSVPEGLSETLKTVKELELVISTALNLHHLKHDALPLGVEEEAIPVIDSVNHRLLNEAACSLLADDNLLKTAVQELDVLPSVLHEGDTPTTAPISRSNTPTELTPGVVVDSSQSKELPALMAEKHVANHLKFFTSIISLSITAFSKELVAPVMGKIFSHGLLQALAVVAERFTHPHSTPSVAFAVPSAASQSMRGASVSQSRDASPESISQQQAPSRPASSSGSSLIPTAPSASTTRIAAPPSQPSKDNGLRRPPRAPRLKQAFKMYSPIVEHELASLLDATLVRLNEKQEEVALNDFFRIPILDHPDRYSGLVHFLVRQMCTVPNRDVISQHSRGAKRPQQSSTQNAASDAPSVTEPSPISPTNQNPSLSSSRRPSISGNHFSDALVPAAFRLRSDMQNRMLLYHLLGMHDDEGSSSTERALDPENDARRHEFQGAIIRQYLTPALKNPAGFATPNSSEVAPPTAEGATGSSVPTSHESNSTIPSAVPPTLIRVLDYLLRLANHENRNLLLTRIFDPSSRVIALLEHRFKIASSHPRTFPINVLCEDVRFIKTLFGCFSAPVVPVHVAAGNGDPHNTALNGNHDDTSSHHEDSSALAQVLSGGVGTHEQDAKLMSLVAKGLTLERPIVMNLLEVYNACGGQRKQGLLHCTIRSAFQTLLFAKRPEADTIRMYFLLKYRTTLPPCFVAGFEKLLLDDVVGKLDVHAVVGRQKDSLSPQLLGGVSHLDISAASSSPAQSPPGKYLSVDELASPPDARQMEDIAAFPRRLRQAIGRLSPTPRTVQSELDEAAAVQSSQRLEMPLLPLSKGGSSPVSGALAVSQPISNSASSCSAANRPPLEPLDLSAPPPFAVASDASSSVCEPVQQSASSSSPSSPGLQPGQNKPTAPKQAKGASTGRGSGRQLGDGKPLIRSK